MVRPGGVAAFFRREWTDRIERAPRVSRHRPWTRGRRKEARARVASRDSTDESEGENERKGEEDGQRSLSATTFRASSHLDPGKKPRSTL